MRKTPGIFTTKVFVLMFAALTGISLFAIWKVSLPSNWPWLICLGVSVVGLLVTSRDLK